MDRLWLIAVLCAFSGSAMSQSSPLPLPHDPFVGDWKFVADQSHFASAPAPRDIRLRIVLNKGRLREEEETIRADGSRFKAVFIHQYDGAERPLDMSGDTKHRSHSVRWTRRDERTIERRINHDDGKLFTIERLQLSSDLNTLTETHFRANSDEPPFEAVETFVRQ